MLSNPDYDDFINCKLLKLSQTMQVKDDAIAKLIEEQLSLQQKLEYSKGDKHVLVAAIAGLVVINLIMWWQWPGGM